MTKIYGHFSFIHSLVDDHSTKIRVLIDLFICAQPFEQNIWSSFIYSFFCTRPFDQKLESSLIYFFYLHTTIRLKDVVLFHLYFLLCATIRPKIKVHIDLFLLFPLDHSTKICGPLSFIPSLWTIIRPKTMVLIILFLLFVRDHLTKTRGHSYSLIYSFLNCANISYAVFMAALPLYFVRYIHGYMKFTPLFSQYFKKQINSVD